MAAGVRQRRGGTWLSDGEGRRECQGRQTFLLGHIDAASLVDQKHGDTVDNAVDPGEARVVEDLNAAIDPIQQGTLVLGTGEDVEKFLSESHASMLRVAHEGERATRIVQTQYR